VSRDAIYREKFEEMHGKTAAFVERCLPQAVDNLKRKARMRNSFSLESVVDVTKPAVICAAGPSVSDVIETILAHREKVTLYCVDTALPAMTCAGVWPDVVVTLDPEGHLLRSTLSVYPPPEVRMILLAPTYLHRDVFEVWPFPIYAFNTIDQTNATYSTIARLFAEYRGFMAKPNVAQFAINVAYVLGHPAIAWAGMDHASRPDKHYADGVLVDDQDVRRTDQEILTVDQNMRPIRTSGSYALMAEVFVYHYVHYYHERPCFNLSSGLLPFKRDIEGFEAFLGSEALQNATLKSQ
jgi:hypothetical protein